MKKTVNKHEQVMIIPAAAPGDCNLAPGFSRAPETVVRRLLRDSKFVDRGPAETDETHRQIIVYDIYETDKYFFTYRRRWGDDRLVGRWSVGVGGHVNAEDARDKVGLGGLDRARDRERAEELGEFRIHKIEYAGVVYSDARPVDRAHLGIVMHHHCGDMPAPPHRDWPEHRMATAAELARDVDKFEVWSQILIREYINHRGT
jgi:predicted NUDIX family phosphoesterase